MDTKNAAWIAIVLLFFGAPAVSAYESSTGEMEAEGIASQEMVSDEAMASREMEGSIQGRVIGVNGLALVVKETEYTGDLYTFNLREDTSVTGASSVSDIQPDDIVNVDYYVMGDNRVADDIVVQRRAEKPEAASALEKVLVD